MILRPYQQATVDAVRAEYQRGLRSTLAELPTGTGKTVIFAEIARLIAERGRRVLVLAHRTELLKQARAKLHAVGCDAAIEKAALRAGDASVVVASVQTLKGKRLESWPRDAFALVIVDEAHHAVAAGYRAILEHFASARVLGVTATPDRLDGAALGEVFQSCAYRYELRAAIADGWLCPLVARRVELAGVNLAEIHTMAGDLKQGELAEVMQAEAALHGVAVPLLEQAGDRKTIAFAVDVAHAHALAEVLNRYRPGIAIAVDGSAPEAVREASLAMFVDGRCRILVNCSLYTEGFDVPDIACVAIARPTKSRALYAQMVGRGTRLSPETGKRDLLVLDFTGRAGKHRLVGPADVLAGGDGIADDEVRAEVEGALSGGQLELAEVIAQAEETVRARRERLAATAVADYLAEEFDPFLGTLPPLMGAVGAWVDEPATVEQRRSLEERHRMKKLPPQLTKGEAQRLLSAFDQREQLGLCTYPQAAFLARQGYDVSGMSKARASQLCGQLISGFRSRRAAVGGAQ